MHFKRNRNLFLYKVMLHVYRNKQKDACYTYIYIQDCFLIFWRMAEDFAVGSKSKLKIHACYTYKHVDVYCTFKQKIEVDILHDCILTFLQVHK